MTQRPKDYESIHLVRWQVGRLLDGLTTGEYTASPGAIWHLAGVHDALANIEVLFEGRVLEQNQPFVYDDFMQNLREGARAVGYIRVSTGEQVESGAGLEGQRQRISEEASRRGWALVGTFEDAGLSGKSLSGRTGLQAALSAIRAGDADTLVVSKLDRLSRSLADFAGLMATAQREGWALVALDLGIDTSTPAGEFLANVLASAAQWERRIIGERTRSALAIKKQQGVKLGRPRQLPEPVVQRILEAKRNGAGFSEIARQLNDDAVPTARGASKWHPATVRAVVLSREDQR